MLTLLVLATYLSQRVQLYTRYSLLQMDPTWSAYANSAYTYGDSPDINETDDCTNLEPATLNVSLVWALKMLESQSDFNQITSSELVYNPRSLSFTQFWTIRSIECSD